MKEVSHRSRFHVCSFIAISFLLVYFYAHLDERTNTVGTRVLLRHRRHQKERLSTSNHSCVVLLANKHYESSANDHESLCFCELHGEDLGGAHFKLVKITGLPEGWCHNKSSGIKSAQTELITTSREMNIDYNSSELILSRSIRPKIRPIPIISNDKNITTIMTRNSARREFSVLVIRGDGYDRSTSYSARELSNSIFGTFGDRFNLRSQYSACSYNQIGFKPATRIGIRNGVYDVNIPYRISGNSDSAITNAMIDQAEGELGSRLNTIADFVMVCVPPGTRDRWVAYAITGYWLSVYNDRWCTYPSAQMHEIGHNLNLAHSGERNNQYGDRSGLMGSSYTEDDGPMMCFNGVKTHQLGWFKEFHQEISLRSGYFTWEGNLLGFANRDLISNDEKMIIRMTDRNLHYFVHFNRADRFNKGTREGRDQVLVASSYSRQDSYMESSLLAKLNAGQRFTITDFVGGGSNGLLQIFVSSINLGTNRARVIIDFQPCRDDNSYTFTFQNNSGNSMRRRRRRKRQRTRQRAYSRRMFQRNCRWIAQLPRRINSYCNDPEIRGVCRRTCRVC